MALLGILVDSKLKARQDQLNAQWSGLNAQMGTIEGSCASVPGDVQDRFHADLKGWLYFYYSGSDWSASDANATNEWQTKAQEYANEFATWGCASVFSDSPAWTAGSSTDSMGTITINDAPPDSTSLIDGALNAAKGVVSTVYNDATGAVTWTSYLIIGLIILVVLSLGYVLTHAKVSTAGGTIG